MALPIIPILLLGAAAAVVVSSKKKSSQSPATNQDSPARQEPSRPSRADACPQTISIERVVLEKVKADAERLHRSNPDPSVEAVYIVENALPSTCSRSNLTSTFNMEIPVSGQNGTIYVSVPLSVPELYMLVLQMCALERLNSKTVTLKESNVYFDREAAWYKQVTGKNFDAVALDAKMGKAINDALQA